MPRLPGNVIDGKKIADDIRTELKPRLTRLADAGVVPGLAAVLVGENPASQLYVKMKGKAGLGYCNVTKCCTEVCPEHIKITDNAIIPLKERMDDAYFDPVRSLVRRLGKRSPAAG